MQVDTAVYIWENVKQMDQPVSGEPLSVGLKIGQY